MGLNCIQCQKKLYGKAFGIVQLNGQGVKINFIFFHQKIYCLKKEGKSKWFCDKENQHYVYEGELEEGKPNGIGKIVLDEKIIWEGRWKFGEKFEGRGTSIYIDNEKKCWIYKGELVDSFPVDGKQVLHGFKNLDKLRVSLKSGKLIGTGILTENKREYFVEFDENGNEKKDERKRTFESVKLMINGNENVGNY